MKFSSTKSLLRKISLGYRRRRKSAKPLDMDSISLAGSCFQHELRLASRTNSVSTNHTTDTLNSVTSSAYSSCSDYYVYEETEEALAETEPESWSDLPDKAAVQIA